MVARGNNTPCSRKRIRFNPYNCQKADGTMAAMLSTTFKCNFTAEHRNAKFIIFVKNSGMEIVFFSRDWGLGPLMGRQNIRRQNHSDVLSRSPWGQFPMKLNKNKNTADTTNMTICGIGLYLHRAGVRHSGVRD